MQISIATKPTLTAVLCLALGMGVTLSTASAQSQGPSMAASSEADRTAQPPGGVDLDTNFWVLVRDSRDPNALRSYLDSFPAGKFAAQARQKIDVLREQQGKTAKAEPVPSAAPINPPAAVPPAPSAAESKDLARSLQRELKRVGCLDAEADGVWGEKSRTALKSFVRHAKLGITGDEPNISVLDAASATKARVCPLVCEEGEKVVGDRCVSAAKPRPVRREEAAKPAPARRAWAERPAAERGESRGGGNPNAGKRICFGAGRNEIVTCQ